MKRVTQILLEAGRSLGLPVAPEAEIIAPLRPAKNQSKHDGPYALLIPCPDSSTEDTERDSHRARGQFLARQDRWQDLVHEIRQADQARKLTSGGMPVAELLSYGARADVVLAVEHALLDGFPAKGAPILQGIEDLEAMLEECPGDEIMAAIVAQTHMDIGWAWRGNGWDSQVPAKNRAAFEAHFDRASEILTSFMEKKSESPLLKTAFCAQLCGHPEADLRLANDYEALIDLNPLNPGPMRAMGSYLLPRWFGNYAKLELEARRTAARTQHIWGAGAYTWVMFDAISGDDQACAQLDIEFFIEGLHDILQRRPNQHTVNLLAAYCANTIGQAFSGHEVADGNRALIADCADWIVRKYLVELHPMIWAHAARGFDNTLRVRSARSFAAAGRADALRIISNLFRPEISAGHRIIFTAEGPVAEHA